jgi:hypothetical protein
MIVPSNTLDPREVLTAMDFFTVKVWTGGGLERYHVLFVIQLATRALKSPSFLFCGTELR